MSNEKALFDHILEQINSICANESLTRDEKRICFKNIVTGDLTKLLEMQLQNDGVLSYEEISTKTHYLISRMYRAYDDFLTSLPELKPFFMLKYKVKDLNDAGVPFYSSLLPLYLKDAEGAFSEHMLSTLKDFMGNKDLLHDFYGHLSETIGQKTVLNFGSLSDKSISKNRTDISDFKKNSSLGFYITTKTPHAPSRASVDIHVYIPEHQSINEAGQVLEYVYLPFDKIVKNPLHYFNDTTAPQKPFDKVDFISNVVNKSNTLYMETDVNAEDIKITYRKWNFYCDQTATNYESATSQNKAITMNCRKVLKPSMYFQIPVCNNAECDGTTYITDISVDFKKKWSRTFGICGYNYESNGDSYNVKSRIIVHHIDTMNKDGLAISGAPHFFTAPDNDNNPTTTFVLDKKLLFSVK